MSRRFSIMALLTASLFLCLMAGCWNPFKPDKDDGGGGGGTEELLPRTSPENVLFDLRVIYGNKDNIVNTLEDAHTLAEQYRTLFHPDTFTFYFIEGDQPDDVPVPWWGLNEEAWSFEHQLLNAKVDGRVQDITLSWTVGASVPDNRVDGMGQPVHPTWRYIHVTAILLDVFEGEIDHQLANGTADYYFAPDPANSALWVITEWRELLPPGGGSSPRSVAAAGASRTTWGHIKGLYR